MTILIIELIIDKHSGRGLIPKFADKRIPLLSVIVVKQDGSPGEGFDGMAGDWRFGSAGIHRWMT
jgi:hypothetical protein